MRAGRRPERRRTGSQEPAQRTACWVVLRVLPTIMARMRIHWRDIDDRLEPTRWDSLLFTVEDAHAPTFAVSVCPPDRLRLSAGETPVLWARVEQDYYGYAYLRKGGHAPLSIVPPIPFALADEIAEQAPEARPQLWARQFATGLSASSASPLHRGEWTLSPRMRWHKGAVLAPGDLDGILAHEQRGDVAWDHHVHPLPLRDMSPSDSGRVKAWRKLARRDALPPVLLHWVSGLVAYVVLDGHDRLLAAKLEGAPAPFLCLDRVAPMERDAEHRQMVLASVAKAFEHAGRTVCESGRESRLFTAGKANRILLDAFTPLLVEQRTMAESTRFDSVRWEAEVREEAMRQGVDASEMVDVRSSS
jgi:hypothetical protein